MQKQSNLNVYQQTLAKRIIFDNNKKATGVIVNSGGSNYQLNATKEVIVSAGTVMFTKKPRILGQRRS